jgi:hypothetical protein
VTQAEIEQEIANLRGQVAQLEQRQSHWRGLEKACRAMAIAFAVTAVAVAVAGAVLTYHDRPNQILPIALSFVLASLPLGMLGQALRAAPP